MVGIYKITNTENGKVYIGQSIDINKRFKEHKRSLRKGEHENYRLQDDWNVYGEDAFSFEIIQKCRSSNLNEIEKHLIGEYNSTSEENGYNISAGCGRDLSVPSWYTAYCSRREWYSEEVFFKNSSGETEYNPICCDCGRECKQSFRAEILSCPKLSNR